MMIETRKAETTPDPTIEEEEEEEASSSTIEEPEPELTENKKLQEQLRSLEQVWDSIKKSNPPRTLHRRCSTDSKSMVKTLQYTNTSPTSLMSQLQQSNNNKSLSGGTTAWKVRTNELAVDEILRERRAAIESGQLKGRSLLEAFDGTIEVCNGWPDLNQEREVRSMDYDDYHDGYHDENESENDQCNYGRRKDESSPVCCCDCDSCLCSSQTCDNLEGTVVAVEDAEEHKSIVCELGFMKPWLATALLVVLCIILVMSFGEYGDDEVILVPT